MSRVIKSTYARVDAAKPVIIGRREKKPDEPQAAESVDEVSARDLEAEFQEAYDELLAAAQDEVALMLEDAKSEAAKIRSECEKECEVIMAEAYNKGHGDGLTQAQSDLTELFDRAQADINATLAAAYDERDKILNDSEPRVFKLAIDIAEKILNMQLDRDDSAFLSMVENALASIKSEKKVELHVNPADYVRFFKTREVNLHTVNGNVAADVYNDPTIDSYGCLIEAESGMVDAGADAQLSQIQHGFGLE